MQPAEIIIGEKIPNLLLDHIINTPEGKIRLAELHKDQFLIIDFWEKWCVPCIREMKFLDSLTAKNPRKFKVLMVSGDTKEEITKFISKSTNIKIDQSQLVFAAENKFLAKLFPHHTIPHNIWINNQGEVKAITSGTEITEKNIFKFGNASDSVLLRTKKDNFTFIPSKTFHLGDSTFTYRSIITPFIDGIGSGELSPQKGQMSAYFQWNQSILRAIWGAYSNFNPHMRLNLIEIRTKDSVQFFPPNGNSHGPGDRAEWERAHLFSYALTLPKKVPDSLFSIYIYQDMMRQFGIRVSKENRMTDCIVVTRNGKELKKSEGNQSIKASLRFTPNYTLVIKNANISDILDLLYRTIPSKQMPLPYLNKVKLLEDEYFNLELDFSKESNVEQTGVTPEMIHNRFSEFGFKFQKEKHLYPKLIVTD